MSADNYYFVRKTEDGDYGVSHRWASMYYRDEILEIPMEARGFEGSIAGWKLLGDSVHGDRVFATYEEANKAATRRPDWIEDPPDDDKVFDTFMEALLHAFKLNYENGAEYGVRVHDETMRSQF